MARQLLLLDTHTFLWALTEPGRLSARARALIADPDVDRTVSSVSAYEIAQLVRKGRLPGGVAVVGDYLAHLERLRATELPLRSNASLLAGSLPARHGDPFDRIIAAQAMLEGIPVATVDREIARLGALTIW